MVLYYGGGKGHLENPEPIRVGGLLQKNKRRQSGSGETGASIVRGELPAEWPGWPEQVCAYFSEGVSPRDLGVEMKLVLGEEDLQERPRDDDKTASTDPAKKKPFIPAWCCLSMLGTI